MSRLSIPTKFIEQFELYIEVRSKHDTDGPASPLTAFLVQNEIDLDAGLAAHLHDDAHDTLSRQSEQYLELRNLHFRPVMKHLRSCFQFLKHLYSDNMRSLGLWGGTVNERGRMAYPPDFLRRCELFKLLYEKHQSYPPGTSPLQPFLIQNEINLAADAAAVATARQQHDWFEAARRGKEQEREARDQIWKPMMKDLRKIGAFLKALYRGNPHQLGAWGFTVDSSPKKRHPRRTKIKPLQARTLRGIFIGSEVENAGPVALQLFRGRGKKGEPMTLAPGEKWVVKAGFSKMTYYNPSPKETGLMLSLIA